MRTFAILGASLLLAGCVTTTAAPPAPLPDFWAGNILNTELVVQRPVIERVKADSASANIPSGSREDMVPPKNGWTHEFMVRAYDLALETYRTFQPDVDQGIGSSVIDTRAPYSAYVLHLLGEPARVAAWEAEWRRQEAPYLSGTCGPCPAPRMAAVRYGEAVFAFMRGDTAAQKTAEAAALAHGKSLASARQGPEEFRHFALWVETRALYAFATGDADGVGTAVRDAQTFTNVYNGISNERLADYAPTTFWRLRWLPMLRSDRDIGLRWHDAAVVAKQIRGSNYPQFALYRSLIGADLATQRAWFRAYAGIFDNLKDAPKIQDRNTGNFVMGCPAAHIALTAGDRAGASEAFSELLRAYVAFPYSETYLAWCIDTLAQRLGDENGRKIIREIWPTHFARKRVTVDHIYDTRKARATPHPVTYADIELERRIDHFISADPKQALPGGPDAFENGIVQALELSKKERRVAVRIEYFRRLANEAYELWLLKNDD